MQVSSISSLAGASAAGATAPAGASKQVLGVNDFLKLLATQFKSQDPMKPMDDTAFIAQTAQFTSLQQTNTLVQTMTQMSAAQDFATANSYLGRQVTVDLGKGQTAIGNVTGVDASGGAPKLMINGRAYSLSAVLYVEPGAVSAPAPSPVPAGGA